MHTMTALHNVRLTLKWGANCAQCGTTINENVVAWNVRGAPRGKTIRCMDCGPHPEGRMPTRHRPTLGEGLKMRAREIATPAILAAPKPAPRPITPVAPIAIPQAAELVDIIARADAHEARLDRHDTALTTHENEGIRLAGRVSGLMGRMAKLESERAPLVIEYRTPTAISTVIGAHRSLATVLRLISAGISNVYLVGPAGTGKTTLLEGVGKHCNAIRWNSHCPAE